MGTGERGYIGPESHPESTDVPAPDALLGTPLVGRDGSAIGVIEDVYVDSEGTYVRARQRTPAATPDIRAGGGRGG